MAKSYQTIFLNTTLDVLDTEDKRVPPSSEPRRERGPGLEVLTDIPLIGRSRRQEAKKRKERRSEGSASRGQL